MIFMTGSKLERPEPVKAEIGGPLHSGDKVANRCP
jgi:hypothetical protein